jgi:hypothetical protein
VSASITPSLKSPHAQTDIDPLLHQVDVPIVEYDLDLQVRMAREELR